ncbi:MAG: adenine phosphoribosyltransferase [Verrucomicrobiota bacterium]
MTFAILNGAKERIKSAVRDIPDFPIEGVVFKDITPILENADLFRLIISLLSERYKSKSIERVVAIDARGFLIGSALAYVLGVGVAIVRKKGKLPHRTISASYSLEYGEATVEMHEDSIEEGQRVLIIDDVLATGGTMGASIDLVQRLGGKVVECAFLMELGFLNGRKKLGDQPVFSILEY